MRMRRRQLIAVCGALWAQGAASAAAQPFVLGPPDTLEETARRVEREFPDVAHVRPDHLSARLGGAETVLLLDVRETAEFDVSHLSGAERVAPEISSARALAQIGERADGAALVFYCSVGQRSSRLASRTQRALAAAGARAVYNLRGGIFAWHNEARPLVDRFGQTPYVHPYRAAWRRLLTRPQLATMRPRSAAL